MLRLLIIGLILITGCQAYTPRPQVLPQHIKKIAVRPFVNHTSQLGLEDKLRLRIIDEFLQDTRFTIQQQKMIPMAFLSVKLLITF